MADTDLSSAAVMLAHITWLLWEGRLNLISLFVQFCVCDPLCLKGKKLGHIITRSKCKEERWLKKEASSLMFLSSWFWCFTVGSLCLDCFWSHLWLTKFCLLFSKISIGMCVWIGSRRRWMKNLWIVERVESSCSLWTPAGLPWLNTIL